MTVVTSNHKYPILSFCELEEKYQRKARKEFNWVEDLEESYGFFIYKKEVYNLGHFMRHNNFLIDDKSGKKLYAHGVYMWSASNGLALEFVDKDSAVKIAYYYS